MNEALFDTLEVARYEHSRALAELDSARKRVEQTALACENAVVALRGALGRLDKILEDSGAR